MLNVQQLPDGRWKTLMTCFLYPFRCIFCSIELVAPKRVYMLVSLVSEFVRQKRKAVKLTQPELAEKAGVGLRFLRELEQGKQAPRLDNINHVLRLSGHEMGPVPQPRPSAAQRRLILNLVPRGAAAPLPYSFTTGNRATSEPQRCSRK